MALINEFETSINNYTRARFTQFWLWIKFPSIIKRIRLCRSDPSNLIYRWSATRGWWFYLMLVNSFRSILDSISTAQRRVCSTDQTATQAIKIQMTTTTRTQ